MAFSFRGGRSFFVAAATGGREFRRKVSERQCAALDPQRRFAKLLTTWRDQNELTQQTAAGFQPNRPSPTFTGFLEHLRRDSALGHIPFEFAADSSKIGGAGVRLVVAKADRRFSYRQLILFAAGKYKSIGVAGTSLTDEQRAWLQAQLDETYADFKAAVLARGRRITPDVMEGQCFSGRKASYNSLTSGVVGSRAEALMKLQERHVR